MQTIQRWNGCNLRWNCSSFVWILVILLVGCSSVLVDAFSPGRASFTTTARHSKRSAPSSLLPPCQYRECTVSFNARSSSSSKRRNVAHRILHRTSRTLSLFAKKDDDSIDDNNNNNNNNSPIRAAQTALIDLWTRVLEFWSKIQTMVVSFGAGVAFAAAAFLVPIYSSSNPLVQPVTLFETILEDLSDRYVDTVNTQELFETGVTAMLQSLDPYTEFEPPQQAQAVMESIDGKYGGVGLVISGATTNGNKLMNTNSNNKLQQQQQPPKLDEKAREETNNNNKENVDNKDTSTSSIGTPLSPSASASTEFLQDRPVGFSLDDDLETEEAQELQNEIAKAELKAQAKGIRVMSAFEGYAYDYGLRVGDKLVAVDDTVIQSETTVDQVRNVLRGEPGSIVTIQFERDGVAGTQTITMPRAVVQVRDVRVATLLPNQPVTTGYVRLTAFSSDTGPQLRRAIQSLQRQAEDASNGETSLEALILDLRGNPGGLLTSAVDVCSLLVPKGSDIVSAKGRGFPGILYRSRVDPILDTAQTKLAVLVNGQTASAAEIVSGAIQDLDVGVVVGSGRTYGKGLVQNVETLPYDSALKFTVAKYYTPSGRCIQGVNYSSGGAAAAEEGSRFIANKVAEEDRSTFYTKGGRVVRDGGGVEADLKVQAPRASALEVTLLRSGVFGDFAAQWSKSHELTNYLPKAANQKLQVVDEDTYKEFQTFVMEKQKNGELELDALYSRPLSDLKKTLEKSGYKGSAKSVEQLQARIVRDVQADFETYRKDIKEDISQNILARYLPESMLIERGLESDIQVQAAIRLVQDQNQFRKLLGSSDSSTASSTLNMAASASEGDKQGYRSRVSF